MIVVATEEEYKLAKKTFKGAHIVKTGVGGINVYKTLNKYDRWQKIVNFGYCGSNNIPIGTEIRVGRSELYHPNVNYKEPKYKLDGNITCYTSSDFVVNTDIKKPCVFDMELAFILAMGFKNVKSIKIVSDNLDLKQYEEGIKNDRKG